MGTIALSPDGNTLTINGYEFKRATTSEGDMIFTYGGSLNTYHIRIKDGKAEFALGDASYKKIADLGSVNPSYLWWANKDSAGTVDLNDTQKAVLQATSRIAPLAPVSLGTKDIKGTKFDIGQDAGYPTVSFADGAHANQKFYYDGKKVWGVDPRQNDGKPVDLTNPSVRSKFGLSPADAAKVNEALKEAIKDNADTAREIAREFAGAEIEARRKYAEKTIGEREVRAFSEQTVFGNVTVKQFENKRGEDSGSETDLFGGGADANQKVVSAQMVVPEGGVEIPGVGGRLPGGKYERVPDESGRQRYYEYKADKLREITEKDEPEKYKQVSAAFQQTVVDAQLAQRIEGRTAVETRETPEGKVTIYSDKGHSLEWSGGDWFGIRLQA